MTGLNSRRRKHRKAVSDGIFYKNIIFRFAGKNYGLFVKFTKSNLKCDGIMANFIGLFSPRKIHRAIVITTIDTKNFLVYESMDG